MIQMPETIHVNSENDIFQKIEALKRNRQKRQKSGVFFVEGVKAINSALKFNWAISAFIYCSEKSHSRWAENILQNYSADKHFQLKTPLMEQISDKENTSELIALVKIPADDPARIKFSSIPLVIVLDRPANPGNIGTIIRSCDSFNADGLIITGHAADLYDPQTIRASVGTIFSLPVIRMASYKNLLSWFKQLKIDWKDMQIIGSSAKANKLLFDIDLKKPLIYLLGNETRGLSENCKAICHEMLRIPIQGTASSLNLASAAAISLYEIFKQRNNQP